MSFSCGGTEVKPPKCGCICQHPVTNRLFANYFIPCFIQPPFGGCLRLLIAIAPHRYASMARCIAIPKTAEERLYTLARGWLAYPVTPTHAHLPPKSGCRGIQRGAFRRGATTPSRNPVRGAKRQRAGTQPSPSQLRAGGTPLPRLRRLPPTSSAIII